MSCTEQGRRIVQTAKVPDDLGEILAELGASATLDEMSPAYRRRAFLFIEQAGNAVTRASRVSNFVEVVKFFKQDAEEMRGLPS